ncbi:MAG: gliding motility-associated C-terminal domain-containing protein [Bacteroidetes bacterium]|nr:gliding motility-associated C-terminal domain-containing protein [Bacteroidota bacterium]
MIALTGVPLPLSPQIVTPTGTYFTDKTNWVRISGLYHARGGEQLIYIGNFDDQQQLIKVKQYYDGIGTRNFCMYYVDDVAVVPLSDVFLHPLPADTTVCDTTGMSMLLSVPAGVYDSLRWSDGSTTQQLQITAPGIYYIDGWSGDCHARDSITISFTPPLILGITHTDMQACADAFPVPIQAPPGYSAYYWSTGDTSAAIPAAVSGIYTVQLRDGCSSYADTFRLSSVPLPTPPQVADTSFCHSEVHGAISATGDSLRWYADGTGSLLPAAPVAADSPAHQFYYVTQTVLGCESAPSGVRVTILSPPPAVLGTDQVHCTGVAVPIGSTAGAGTSYRWSTGDTSAQITVTAAGSYSRTATNLCGTITETVAIGLTDCDSACIYAPNAFTPNGDGTNDAYKVYTRCPFRFFEIRIFDRWGEQLYQSYDIGDAWDGSYRGQALEPGVFVYHLFLTTEEGNTEMHKGSVTLIR